MAAIVHRAEDYPAFKMSAGDRRYFACLGDPAGGEAAGSAGLAAAVEILPPGESGAALPGSRQPELLFVLKGKARTRSGGVTRLIEPGDTMILAQDSDCVIENVGPGKLYALTVFRTARELAERLRGGVKVRLDREDLGVLRRLPLRR